MRLQIKSDFNFGGIKIRVAINTDSVGFIETCLSH
jgi:hypothetical protein